MILIKCTTVENIDSWDIASFDSSSVAGHDKSIFVRRPSSFKARLGVGRGVKPDHKEEQSFIWCCMINCDLPL